MNDKSPPSGGSGSEYSGFLTEATSNVDEIFEVANKKITEEEHWLLVEAQSGAGTVNYLADDKHLGVDYYGESAPVLKKVNAFAESHCFDTTDIEATIDNIVLADNLIDENQGTYRTKITSGLDSWDESKSDAAKAFKENYVTSMDEFYKNQGITLNHYYHSMLTIVGIVQVNRKLLKALLQDSKKEMNEYSPFWGVTNPWLSWTLDISLLMFPEAVPVKGGISFVSKKVIEGVAGKLIGSGKKSMDYEESVANIVQGIMDGIDYLEKQSNEACNSLSDMVKAYNEEDTPGSNVFACPRY